MGIASDFILIVIAGLLGAILARAAGLPILVGYVAAGVVVGPHTAGPTVAQVEDIERLAELGVALLLFSLGLELQIRDLLPVRGVALVGGALQVALTSGLAGWAGVRFLGMTPVEGAWFGAAVSVSSTMVVLKTLSVGGLTGTLASRVMVGILVFQDLAVIPFLVVLPELQAPQGLMGHLARSLAIAGAILAGMVFLGNRVLPPVLMRVLSWGSRELFLVSVVAISVGVGALAHLAGLSFALGAFVAGIILSETEFSHQALSDVVPLRDIFGLLFFVTVGMLFDPAFVRQHPLRLPAAIFLIIAGKALVTGLVVRLFGYVRHAPWIVGLGLAQIGEFSFVLARSGLAAKAISRETYDLLLSSTVLTMALSPVVSSLSLPLARAWTRRFDAAPAHDLQVTSSGLSDHAIVAGYGRTGRAASRVLSAAAIPYVVVELDHAVWGDAVNAGVEGIWGDVTSEEVLRAAGIARARVLLITAPDHASVRLCALRARAASPKVAVIARANRPAHHAELRDLGVTGMVEPEFEGGAEMVRQALNRFGVGDVSAQSLVAAARAQFYGAPR